MPALCISLAATPQTTAQPLERIITDIYGQLTEDGADDVDYEQLYDDLADLAANPIDINNATDAELERLPFLNQKQRDDIRYFTYMYGGFHSIAELQLIRSLADYDIRNIAPFVFFAIRQKTDTITPAKWSAGLADKSRHTVTLRTDYRSTADISPYYITARYQYVSKGKIKAGVSATKYAGQPWDRQGFNHYGLYAELSNISNVVSRIAIGDYRADYGAGLVMGSQWMSSVSVLMSARRQQGIRARSSASQTGTYLRGAAIELHPTDKSQISVFYSFRHLAQRDTNQHIAGMHAAYRWKHFALGATVAGRFASAFNDYADRIYTVNYMRSTKSITAGIDYQLSFKKADFNGELAFTPHGLATHNTLSVSPSRLFRLTVSQRYYSPRFDNPYAHTFSRYSRVNDELGLYIGMQWYIGSKWTLRAYADGHATRFAKSRIYQPATGFEYMAQAVCRHMANTFDVRLKWRRDEENYANPEAPTRSAETVDRGQARFTYSRTIGTFSCATQLYGTLAKRQHYRHTLGAAITQRLAYSIAKFSVSAQLTAFQATEYNNRIYIYERDVLYAFSMPSLQGAGLRYAVNVSWHVIPQLTIQLHAAQTLYAQTTSYDKKPFVLRLQARLRI